MEEYGNRFAELRINNDLKQKEIAKILNVKESTYSKWEKGINDISLNYLNTLANFYNVNLDYLLGLTKTPKETDSLKINYQELCIRLTLLRKEQHLSQKALSDKIGFAQTTYSSFETGVRIPTTFKLFHIAKFYHVSYDYLVGRKKERSITTSHLV